MPDTTQKIYYLVSNTNVLNAYSAPSPAATIGLVWVTQHHPFRQTIVNRRSLSTTPLEAWQKRAEKLQIKVDSYSAKTNVYPSTKTLAYLAACQKQIAELQPDPELHVEF